MDAPQRPEMDHSTYTTNTETTFPQVFQDEYIQSSATEQLPEATFQRTAQLATELLATLGHEFRTPLAAIKGYSSMLARLDERPFPQERLEYLQIIQEAGQRLETQQRSKGASLLL